MSDPRKNMNTPWRDEELLSKLAQKKNSQQEIADELDTSRKTVGRWLRKFGLGDILKKKPWKGEETLREAYLEHGSQEALAEEFSCSKQTIGKWMDKFDIQVRKRHPSHPFYHKEKLQHLYENHQSTERVREELNCSPNHLKKWMDRHGIERDWKHKDRGEMVNVQCSYCENSDVIYESVRKQSEKWFCSHDCMGSWQSENLVGENSPTWSGGSVFYGEKWYYARKDCRKRDGNTCQNCGEGDDERIPDVHHIEPVRSFDEPDEAHNLDNLVQLCRTCHNKIEKYEPEKQREILNLN